MALDGVLANIPGLAGYLGMQQYQKQNALGDLQGVIGLANAVRQHEEAQLEAQLAPLRQQLFQTQVQQAQQQMLDAQKKREFFSQPNIDKYMTPGSPEIPAPSAEMGGGPGKPAELPKMDFDRLLAAGVANGVLNPETMIARQTQLEERKAAREQRMDELRLRLQDARTTAQEKMAFQQQLAQLQIEARRELAAMTAAMRPPRQDPLVQVEVDDPQKPGQKILRYIPQSQAAGMSPPTKATADKPLTEFQGKAVMFGTRAAQSDKILRDLEGNISNVGLAVKQAAQNTPVFGGVLGAAGNVMLSDNQQRVEQAQRDFVNAVLRQESGAVISENEFTNAKKQYFPQPGDSRAVIEQKRKNREIAIGGFKRMAGPGSADIDSIISAPAMPAAPAKSPDIEELLRKYGG